MRFQALCTCEKVIVDKREVHSLINLIQNVEIETSPDIPKNAVGPNQWCIYTMWVPATEDVGRKFEQVYQVYWPDGEKFYESRFEFTQSNQDIQQITFGLTGFPVGQSGRLRIITWLDHDGHRVSEILETSINVKHIPQPAQRTSPS